MAFGKKKADESFDVDQAYFIASRALKEKALKRASIGVRLTFDDLLMNHFSNKALLKMLGNMTGLKLPKENKDLTEDYEASFYRNVDDEIVVPCRMLKACIVEGAITTGGTTSKAELNRGLRVVGHTSPLRFPEGQHPDMHVCIVRNNTNVPDVRSRALIPAGSTADFVLEFPNTLPPDRVMAALNGAGVSIGIGDWRIEKGGSFGGFTVELLPPAEVAETIRRCGRPEKPYDIPEVYKRAFNAQEKKKGDALLKAEALINHVNGQSPARRRRPAPERAAT